MAQRSVIPLVACLALNLQAEERARTKSLTRNATNDHYSAVIQGWPVEKVLARLGAQTGWRVFLEEGSSVTIATSFTNLPPQQALPRLLGGLNFALVPRDHHPAELHVFRTTITAAHSEVEARDELDPIIRNELLVRLKAGAKLTAAELAALTGGKLIGELPRAGAVRLRFESEADANSARRTLAGNDSVNGVENNLRFEAPDNPVALGNLAAAPLNLEPRVNPDGSRRIVAVIDTAIQPFSKEFSSFVLPQINVVDGQPISDTPLHGTSMVETTIRGLASASEGRGSTVRVLPVNVYGSGTTTTTWDVVDGIYRAVDAGATILNLSLGGPESSQFLQGSVQSITRQGALVFAAAGNSGSDGPFYPAAYPEVTAVTAVNRNGQLPAYANFGSFVDLQASGTALVSLNQGQWITQGTSISSAYIAGFAAGLGSNPQSSLQTIGISLNRTFAFTPPGR
jgi:hypothetical protein